MQTFLMVYAMTFRALNDKTQPIRRTDVPVKEDFHQTCEQQSPCRRLYTETDCEIENRRSYEAVDERFYGMFIERR